MLRWTHSCNQREESGALSVGDRGRGRWEQLGEFIPDRRVRKPALGMILFWRKVSSQPKVAPWLLSSLRFIASKPSHVGGQGWVSVEGTHVPQQIPALVHRMVLGWAGQRSELCRDGLWGLLAVPLQMLAGSSRLEQGFICPESSHVILLGPGSG